MYYCDIEETRFTKPVYPGSTCHSGPVIPCYGTGPDQVKFTVKEKVDQEKKGLTEDSPASPGLDPGAGVKFLVDVVDDTGETVAVATILTMVRKLDQN